MDANGNRVCVIGAGTAGLCALKNALQHGMEATAYEAYSEIGGTWVLNENTKVKKDELVHSSMYEGLRTNLPKEVMGYPDYNYPEHLEESFVPSQEVLKFLQSYARHFNLMPHIRLQHEILHVRPWQDGWEIRVRNKQSDKTQVVHYDFVFVCNGHYTTPLYPEIDGLNEFGGIQLHSHLYRKADVFQDAIVLVVGAGPSGMDITNHICKKAHRVFLSHHMDPAPDTTFMLNVTQKPNVQRFTKNGAIFADGSEENFTHIIFCTGYKYDFPFLSSEVCLRVEDNFVYPLYKHCININYPSMALIGLPFYVCPSQLFDLQVRFVLKFFTKQRELPSQEEMKLDLEKDMQQRWAKGLSKRQAHQMGDIQFDYYKELSELAGIDNIKPVIGKIMEDCSRKYIYELDTYRNSYFKILDDENFVKFEKKSAVNGS